MRKRMFTAGEKFLSEANAVDTIVRGDYVIMRVGTRDKPMHPGWMNGMTISTIRNLVRSGVLFRAVRNT